MQLNPHVQRAQMLYEQRRFEQAERELGQALGQDPDDAWTHALLAACLSARGKHAGAVEMGDRAVALAPEAPEMRYLLARVHLGRNALDDAERTINAAIEMNPVDARFYALRAHVSAAHKSWRKVLDDCQSALSLDAQNLEALNLKSLAERGLGQSTAGKRDLEEALRLNPEDPYSHANLGWAYLEKGELDNAEQHFREALRLEPSLDSARIGAIETLKSRVPIYRWIFSYFIWISRKSGQMQMAIVLGFWVLSRVISGIAAANPAIAPYLQPILWFYGLLCVTTWIAHPLSNATLLLHPFGRMALNRQEKIEATVVGGAFAAVLALLIGAFFDPSEVCLFLALIIGCPAVAVAMSFKFKHPTPRRIMQAAAVVVTLMSLAVATYVFGGEAFRSSLSPALERLVFGTSMTLLPWSLLAVLIGANILSAQQWREPG